jgi:hypothetical protein
MTTPTTPENAGDNGQRHNGLSPLLHWCKRRIVALFNVLRALLVALWRGAQDRREHLLAAWADAQGSRRASGLADLGARLSDDRRGVSDVARCQ